MPNLRGKTWTTTTPANVGDAQYWEDHLISDAVAAKAASSVQSVNNTAPDEQGNVDIVALPDGGTAGQVLTKQSSVDGDADWEDPASSGHTIQDEDGIDMPYQDTLQFVSAEVTNDAVNGKTVVDCKGAKGDPGPQGPQGPQGETGATGPQGPQGVQGDAATITVGTVTTLPAGSQATVNNSGTSGAAVFDFGIPKGADGSGNGDMTKAEYATNGAAGVVDEAVTLEGLTASIADLNKTSSLATVATSGAYADLTGQPAIPTITDTYSATSSNGMSGKAVASAISGKADTSLLKSTVGWTGKNLLSYTQQSITTGGITFTINSDGSITANGTATTNASIEIWNTNKCKEFFKDYKGKEFTFSGGNNGVEFGAQSLQTEGIGEYSADGIEKTLTVRNDVENAGSTLSVKCLVRNGVTVNNITIYPMLRDASITDDTYEPYHESVEEVVEQIYADNGVLGAKNLLQNTATSRVLYGVTFTVNEDKTITINGTQDGTIIGSDLVINGNNVVGGRLKLSDYPSKFIYSADIDVPSTITVGIWFYDASDVYIGLQSIPTGQSEVEIIPPNNAVYFLPYVRVVKSQTVSDITVGIMIRLASDTDDTYVPYAMTNRELTEEKLSISELKTIASSAADFAAFKTAIANL